MNEETGRYLAIDLTMLPKASENFDANEFFKMMEKQGIVPIQPLVRKPKPICVIYYNPSIFARMDGDVPRFTKLMEDKFYDYHILTLPLHSIETVSLEVFYDVDFTDTNYDELKGIIEQTLKDFKEVKDNETEVRY